jgi:hypothetical protein
MKLYDLVVMLFKSTPPQHITCVGEWNELLMFLNRDPVGQVDVPGVE